MMKSCKDCQWSSADSLGDLFCVNDQSEHCADFVPSDICEHFEGE